MLVTIETINLMGITGNVTAFNYRCAEKDMKATNYSIIFSDCAGFAGTLWAGLSYSGIPISQIYCSLSPCVSDSSEKIIGKQRTMRPSAAGGAFLCYCPEDY
jgi:hypothetical protein